MHLPGSAAAGNKWYPIALIVGLGIHWAARVFVHGGDPASIILYAIVALVFFFIYYDTR